MIDDTENGPAFHDFLNQYAGYQVTLLFLSFWHVFFLIGVGTIGSILIFLKVPFTTNAEVGVNVGWKLFLVGFFLGVVDYIAACALTVNQDTILQMTGFLSKADSDTTITKGTYLTDDGTVTTTTSVTQNTEIKKNFFAMNDQMTAWPDLFMLQQSL